MSKIEDAKYKCEVCGNITYNPYILLIRIASPKSDIPDKLKDYDICEQCSDNREPGIIVKYFKKLFLKRDR